MQICRFMLPGHSARLGAHVGDKVFDLTASGDASLQSMTDFLLGTAGYSPEDRCSFVEDALKGDLPSLDWSQLDREPAAGTAHLLPPIDLQEVWAAGVTYLISRDAREEESDRSNIYNRVYDASRPELFFKATPNRVVGHRDYVFVRSDSKWSVPEPELGLFMDSELDIIGFTIGNDVSSRDIEGENPLYLPQAKVHRRCCALGPGVTLRQSDSVPDGKNLEVRSVIYRDGQPVFEGGINTSQIKRSFEELLLYLGRDQEYPNGVVLMTGTGIVPDDFDLTEGDEVEISIDCLGTLRNPVRRAPGDRS
jgi:2-dehydro-3-deoxy-D-arabinonate dehydratase